MNALAALRLAVCLLPELAEDRRAAWHRSARMGSEFCLSRRSFLQRSVAIAGAYQCQRLFETAAAERIAANDIVRVGYIGAGRRAQQLMELPPEAQIVAICDVNAAHKVASTHKARAVPGLSQASRCGGC